MDELKKLNHDQYAYLRQLPIDKLLELLDVAPVPASCPEDEAYMDALEEAIIGKEKENPTGFLPDIDQQWEQFITQYLPDIEESAHEPDVVSAQTDQQSLKAPQKRGVRLGRVWRTALVAAAAVACMLAVMVTVQAAGVDIFGAMARWTEDIFSFGQIAPDIEVSDDPAQETAGLGTEALDSNRVFSSLQEAFDTYGMTEVHEPIWLPEGYALESVDVLSVDDPFLRTFAAAYSDGGRYVNIDILSYEGEPIMQVQKTDTTVEMIEKNGIIFYYVQNTVGGTIAWYTNHYEYYLSSDEGQNILWKIADSMFE